MLDWFGGFFDWLWCLLKSFFNFILESTADIWYYTIGLVLELLPSSPFEFQPVEWGALGNTIGYFLPIGTMLVHFSMLLVAIVLYYIIRHVMRFVQMIK